MIDRARRDHLAHRLRLLAIGRITNDEFEDSLDLESNDPAIWHVFMSGAWMLYSDLHEYKLTGRERLSKECRRNVARVIVFLKSNREYKWVHPKWYVILPVALLCVPTFGWAARWFYGWYYDRQSDWSLWPFFQREEFEAALQHPPYLRG